MLWFKKFFFFLLNFFNLSSNSSSWGLEQVALTSFSVSPFIILFLQTKSLPYKSTWKEKNRSNQTKPNEKNIVLLISFPLLNGLVSMPVKRPPNSRALISFYVSVSTINTLVCFRLVLLKRLFSWEEHNHDGSLRQALLGNLHKAFVAPPFLSTIKPVR